MQNVKKFFVRSVAVVAGVAAPLVSWAQSPFQNAITNVQHISGAAGVNPNSSLETIVGNIINVALGFIGILLLAYLLYAGFLWMTAGGDTEDVKKAKNMIKNAIIGLLIIVAAFAISNFVLNSLIKVAS